MLALSVFVFFAVALFAIFPLTDTDIWWHLACAREWVTTWTPVREPVVNVHEYFQNVVAFVYGLGGAPLLVAFKAVLWGIVFSLFTSKYAWQSLVAIVLIFVFRYHFEIRPILFSLLFLGIYWNVLPAIFEKCRGRRVYGIILVLAIQWLWCKCQGLYILGPLFALFVLLAEIWKSRKAEEKYSRKNMALHGVFVLALFAMPFLHREGLDLFLYPFGLLDRLLGITPSAAIFASEIAENRSPITLLMAGENVLECVLMIVLCVTGIIWSVRIFSMCHPERRAKLVVEGSQGSVVQNGALLVTAILALIAERNFVLFLPILLGTSNEQLKLSKSIFHFSFHIPHYLIAFIFIAFILGLWARSLSAYDSSMVSYQRVPVEAAKWMKQNPHQGHLFNDDRAGGYLAFVNPADSIYIDGRFILKTADFFERYLEYAKNPSLFVADADSLNIDRAVFPLRYYARWNDLLQTLEKNPRWHLAYRDEYFVVLDKF